MNYGKAEGVVGGLPARTVRGRKPSNERHTDVLERVLAGNTATAAPLHCQHETVTNTSYCVHSRNIRAPLLHVPA